MLSSELYYKVNEVHENKVSINGFDYVPVEVTIPGNIDMIVYISDKRTKYIEVGKYYYAKRAYMTSKYVEEKEKENFSFRIDYITESNKEDFELQEDTIVTFNARIGKKSRNVLKFLGPMRIPTYSTRATLKNEVGNTFHILAVGYHSKAKLLNNLCKVCYVDIKGSISAPRKIGMPCAVVVKEVIIRKEVEA